MLCSWERRAYILGEEGFSLMRLWLRTLCVHYFLCAEGENYSQEGKSCVSSCQSSIHISHAEPRLKFHPPLLLLLCTVAQGSIGMNCVTLRFPVRTLIREKNYRVRIRKKSVETKFSASPPPLSLKKLSAIWTRIFGWLTNWERFAIITHTGKASVRYKKRKSLYFRYFLFRAFRNY